MHDICISVYEMCCTFYHNLLLEESGNGPLHSSFKRGAIKWKRSDPKNISGPDFI